MENNFEAYRKHYSAMNKHYLGEAEVVLEAANWRQFADDPSGIALEASDLEALGVTKDLSRVEIGVILEKMSESKAISELPFAKRLEEAIRAEQNKVAVGEKAGESSVATTEDKEAKEAKLKMELAEAYRRTIQKVIEFCKTDETDLPNEPYEAFYETPKSSAWDRLIDRLRLMIKM